MIALIGFNQKNNFGDELMQSLLRHKLVTILNTDVWELNDTTQLEQLTKFNLLCIGGGNIIADNFWILKKECIQFIIEHHIPVAFINVNINKEIINNPDFCAQLRELNARWCVRDTESVRILFQIGIAAQYVPDIVLHNDSEYSIKKPKQAAVFLNQYYFDGLFQNDILTFTQAIASAKILAQYFDWLSYFGWKLIFIPCQTSAHVDDRLANSFVNRFCEHYYNNFLINQSCQDITKYISDSGLIISQRFHPLMVAWSFKRPAITRSFHEKFDYVVKDMGLEHTMVKMEDITAQRLVDATMAAESELYLNQNLTNIDEKWTNFIVSLQGDIAQ